jgi:asparagine synthase (glutamine-hydrolysing)
MCGIAGFIDPTLRGNTNVLDKCAAEMAATLGHRGPDASSTWVESSTGIAFGHTRLSIVDLSSAGAQPMSSGCGRCTITYNGEIYNAAELRDELKAAGRTFRGHSDTEVIVEGCALWGIEVTLKRINGMFAFALWDKKTNKLTLARDRLGIKPLYWGLRDGQLFFASELKALRVLPDWDGEIDPQALAAYLITGYVPAPQCIYKGVRKLEPGKFLEYTPDGKPDLKTYWSLAEVAKAGQQTPCDFSDSEATNQLEKLLLDAVQRRKVSDVPLGAFLSGGIDSSTVAALMRSANGSPVRTFSIGFHEEGYNEAQHAKAVAKHLGTEHTEQYITPDEARDVIPQLPEIYDEPFADSSQIPTFLVSQLARKHVTVALSGDGGDELFAGYNRYAHGLAMTKAARLMPSMLRRAISKGVLSLSPDAWGRLFRAVPASKRPRLVGDKMHKLAGVIAEDETGFYKKLTSQWDGAWALVPGAEEPNGDLSDLAIRSRFSNEVSWMQYLDTLSYLPDDILTKVDRASMAVSLEARVPILDHRVVEFAWSLPHRFKIREGTSKWLLRQVLYRHVPKALIERPKMGFGVPIEAWLRGPLREWGEELLSTEALGMSGLLSPEPIREKWQEHQSGQRNWQQFLWNILMFQAWYEENVSAASSLRKKHSSSKGIYGSHGALNSNKQYL